MDQRHLILLGTALLSMIALGLYWYGEGNGKHKIAANDQQRLAPETLVTGFKQTTFSELGNRRYHIEAKQVVHHSHQSAAKMDKPLVTFYKKGMTTQQQPTTDTNWTATANTGIFNKTEETLKLLGNVNVIKALKKNETLNFVTDSLLVEPKKEIAKTDKIVTIKQSQHTTQAKGLIIDIAAGKMELLSQVRCRYVPTPP